MNKFAERKYNSFFVDISASFVREIWIHTPDTGDSVNLVPNAPELSHPLNQYGFNASQDYSINFDLKVCRDAFVYLSASPVMNKHAVLYEVCIGGNGGNRILLRRNDATFQDVAANELGDGSTQCGSFQPYWISWQNGNIKIGKGLSVDNEVVIDWRDPNPFIIHGVGVRTGLGQIGQWIIHMKGKH
ncbi:C3 and PZP-like alpha-2-macroglobulin domain-containing protein 8 [Mytilus trossulus]|uniref:C3 and PZP-like alpha-2-macroglobulin domain-containing protein 8 n=1 Tax=Mytilus trossulus TaxID=6551 RepID=UPI0030075740